MLLFSHSIKKGSAGEEHALEPLPSAGGAFIRNVYVAYPSSILGQVMLPSSSMDV